MSDTPKTEIPPQHVEHALIYIREAQSIVEDKYFHCNEDGKKYAVHNAAVALRYAHASLCTHQSNLNDLERENARLREMLGRCRTALIYGKGNPFAPHIASLIDEISFPPNARGQTCGASALEQKDGK